MLRYLRLYASFVRFSVSRALQFRLDFWFRVVMDLVFYAVHLAFFNVIYRHTSLLGGWTLDQSYIFVCGVLVVDAVIMTVASNNLWWLPILVNHGDLDYYLVRPVSSFFFVSLREFAANSFVNLLMAGGLLVWALARYPEPLGAGRIVLYLLLLAVGSLLYFLIRMLAVIPVFWLHTSRGLDELSFSLFKLAERPHQIYGSRLRLLLVTALPMALIASVPAQLLFTGPAWRPLAGIAVVTAGLLALTLAFWRRALRAYSSASS